MNNYNYIGSLLGAATVAADTEDTAYTRIVVANKNPLAITQITALAAANMEVHLYIKDGAKFSYAGLIEVYKHANSAANFGEWNTTFGLRKGQELHVQTKPAASDVTKTAIAITVFGTYQTRTPIERRLN